METLKISPGVIPNSVWGTMQAKKTPFSNSWGSKLMLGKNTHGSMPLGKKKMMLSRALSTNLRIDVEAPAPVITFKTCSNPRFVQVKHHHGTTASDNPSQPDTTHQLYTLQENSGVSQLRRGKMQYTLQKVCLGRRGVGGVF